MRQVKMNDCKLLKLHGRFIIKSLYNESKVVKNNLSFAGMIKAQINERIVKLKKGSMVCSLNGVTRSRIRCNGLRKLFQGFSRKRNVSLSVKCFEQEFYCNIISWLCLWGMYKYGYTNRQQNIL